MAGVRRWWALAAIVLSLLTIGFDATILNVALPTLATEVPAGTDQLQWIVDAYLLVFAGLLLPMGALGDRFGRKRMLMLGLIIFAIASLGATWATSAGQLVAARAAMGIGAAILTPITLAVLPVIFGREEQGRAIAVAAMAMGVGVPLGPIVGGYLLDHFWWGSVFLVNVPIALLALASVAVLLPESRDPSPRRVDAVGALLSVVGLTVLVYGIVEAPVRGWSSPVVLGALSLGAVLVVAFAVWERHAREPMIDLSLFGRPRFAWGTLAATLASFALFGLLFVLPQYLQAVTGHGALAVGIRLLPMMGGLIVGAKAGESVAHRIGARAPVSAGLVVIAAGLGLGATTSVTSGYGLAATWLAIVGAGVGLALAPAMDAVLGEVTTERSGSGTALTMTLRQVGGALGVALLGSLSAAAYQDRLAAAPAAARESVAAAVAIAGQTGDAALLAAARSAYVHAMSVVLLVCAVVALVGAVLVAIFLPARRAAVPAPGAVRAESEHEPARTA
jgi:EmrB/QacA subfamily drug resistance transporter